MPLRIQNQEDVVFLQAQEMFPKIEAEVIHMVLSEFGFDLAQALDSLSLLSQSDIPSVSHNCLTTEPRTPAAKPKQESNETGSSVSCVVSRDCDVRHAKVKEPSGVSGDHEAAPATSTLQLKTAMTQQKPPSENHKASKNEEASDDRLAGESLNSEQRPDHQSAPSEGKAKRQYIQLRSYISVGYSNGVRFCFAGNGCRQPTVVNDASSFSKSEHFYKLEKQLSSTAVPFDNFPRKSEVETQVVPEACSPVSPPTAACPLHHLSGIKAAPDPQRSAVSDVESQECNSQPHCDVSPSDLSTTGEPDEKDNMKSTARNWKPNVNAREFSRRQPAPSNRHSQGSRAPSTGFRPSWDDPPPTYGSYYDTINQFPSAPSPNVRNFSSMGRPRHPATCAPRMTKRGVLHDVSGGRGGASRGRAAPGNASHRPRQARPWTRERIMYVLRGAPGSGKTTLASRLCGAHGCVLSTDDYFISPNGEYRFDRNLLTEAHAWNRSRAERALKEGRSPIIIDNTNICAWEMQPYVLKADSYNYRVEIREPETWWKNKVSELERRNHHGVTKASILAMLDRYEKNVTVESLLRGSSSKVQNKPPQNSGSNNNLEFKMSERPALGQRSKPPDVDCASTSGHSAQFLKPARCAVQTVEPKHKQSVAGDEDAIQKTFLDLRATLELCKVNDKEKSADVEANSFSCPAPSGSAPAIKDSALSCPDPSRPKPTVPDCFNTPESSNCSPQQTISHSVLNDLNESSQLLSRTEGDDSLCHPQSSDGGEVGRSSNDAACSQHVLRKKTAKSAANENLLAGAQDLGHGDWTSLLGLIPPASTPPPSQTRNPDKTPSRADACSWTDPDDFVALRKAEQCVGSLTDFPAAVLFSSSANFVSVAEMRAKLPPNVLNKSTLTDDLESASPNESKDLQTLQLLFENLPPGHLRDVYVKCDRNLQWTTDVVAESSLFGLDEDQLISSKKSGTCPSPSVTLDEYYSSLAPAENAEKCESEGVDEPVFSFALPPEALQRLTSFVGEAPEDDVDFTEVELTMDLAKQLYAAWMRTKARRSSKDAAKSQSTPALKPEASVSSLSSSRVFQENKEHSSFELQQIQEDELLARRLQMEEEYGLLPYKKSSIDPTKIDRAPPVVKNPPLVGLSQIPGPSTSRTPPPPGGGTSRSNPAPHSPAKTWSSGQHERKPLTEIMREEMCAEQSEKKRQQQNLETIELASQLKRNQLRDMYPNVPANLLDDIFLANDCNFEQTMMEVEYIFLGDEDTSSSIVKYGSLLPSAVESCSESQTSDEPPTSDSDNNLVMEGERNLTYDEVRAEANLHRNQMLECRRKATAATHQNKGILSMYYSSQAQLHKKRLREANDRAAEITYRQMNEGRSKNELDLHGLHVDEAIDTLRSVLERIERRKKNDLRFLYVITGRGLNSATGVSKIKNAVVEWLKMKNMKFSRANDGCLKITVK